MSSTSNICFDCEKACGGCSWSESFTPVPGWTATPVVRKVWSKVDGVIEARYVETYSITDCPLFEGSAPRKAVDYERQRTMAREGRKKRRTK